MSESKTTTDHKEIKSWVEQRGGQPAVVRGTEENQSTEGLLRIRFDDESSDDLKAIGWDKFFETFEDRKLAFLYQDKTSDNKESRFFKLVNR